VHLPKGQAGLTRYLRRMLRAGESRGALDEASEVTHLFPFRGYVRSKSIKRLQGRSDPLRSHPPFLEQSNEGLCEMGLTEARLMLGRIVPLLKSSSYRSSKASTRLLTHMARTDDRMNLWEIKRRLLLQTSTVELSVDELRLQLNHELVAGYHGMAHTMLVTTKPVCVYTGKDEDAMNRKEKSCAPQALTTVAATSGLCLTSWRWRGLLRFLREVSTSSKQAASVILGCGGVAVAIAVLRLLARDSISNNEICSGALTILWNTLNQEKESVSSALAKSKVNLREIVELMTGLLNRAGRLQHKQLRKELLLIVSILATVPASPALFFDMRLTHQLLAYGSLLQHTEIHSAASAMSRADLDDQLPVFIGASVHLTRSAQDVEMQRFLWILLSDLACTDEATLRLSVTAGFFGALLSFLDVGSAARVWFSKFNSSSTTVAKTTPIKRNSTLVSLQLPSAEFETLQQEALAVLLNFSRRVPEVIHAHAGHVAMIRFVDASTKSSSSTCPHPRLSALVHDALIFLSSLIFGMPSVKDELGDFGTVRIMLCCFGHTPYSIALRTTALQILGEVCEARVGNTASFHRLGGIQAVITELQAYCENRILGSRYHEYCSVAQKHIDTGASPFQLNLSSFAAESVCPLVVAAVECLWKAVGGNQRAQAELPSNGGLEVLLLLLEIGPRTLRHQLCGILADLARSSRLVSHLATWKSQNSKLSVAALLCHMWQDEEDTLRKVRRCHLNIPPRSSPQFCNFSRARVIGGQTRQKGNAEDETSAPSLSHTACNDSVAMLIQKRHSTREISGNKHHVAVHKALAASNLRAKIAPIVDALGCRGTLSAKDPAALVAIRRWTDCRIGEAWASLYAALGSNGVEPIGPDEKLLEHHISLLPRSCKA